MATGSVSGAGEERVMNELLYVVMWSVDGQNWSIVKDEEDRLVPAAYLSVNEAEARRVEMRDRFPDHQYRVRGFIPSWVEIYK